MQLYIIVYETALFAAVNLGNLEMIQLLLKNDKIDVNCLNI